MKNLEIMGVQEMDAMEMVYVDGGWHWIGSVCSGVVGGVIGALVWGIPGAAIGLVVGGVIGGIEP